MKLIIKFCHLLALVILATQVSANPARPGGDTTVSIEGANAFALPSANMSMLRKLDFSVGNSFFRNPWVAAPASTDARDGLGPLFNTNGCQNCHIKDGRGHPKELNDANAVSMLVRLSIPAMNRQQRELLLTHGSVPEPVYGGQFQDFALPGHTAEGQIDLEYEYRTVRLAGGETVELRKPQLQLSELGYGPMHKNFRTSIRIAPPMIGLGLLEAIPEQRLLALADPKDKDGDGISGRPNQVWDVASETTVLGRFGWKAGQPSIAQQNAGAFNGDLGITSSLFNKDDCTTAQTDCLAAPNGGNPELSEKIMRFVEFYSRNLAVPMRRHLDEPMVQQGEALFSRIGCAGCHVPSHQTGTLADHPEQSNQTIYPYTDLLLHDMGSGLADKHTEFTAKGSEWRTPPLWGIGYTEEVNGHTFFLHDGRARNLQEAILWHGGEARSAQQQYRRLSTPERQAVLRFLESL